MYTQRSVASRTKPSRPGLGSIVMLTYQTLPVRHVSEFAAAVREGLLKPEQRELPSKYLYDEVGSGLFEAICLLPEYGLTRAGARVLESHAARLVQRVPALVHL